MSSSTDQAHNQAGQVLAEIRVPRETVNDDTVTVQDWLAKHGEPVRAKQIVCAIETSKAVLEVEADAEGFLEIIHAKGAEVPIGELVGRVLSSKPNEPETQARTSPPSAATTSHTNGTHAAASTTDSASAPARSSNRLRDRMEAKREEAASSAPAASASTLHLARTSGSSGHELPESAVTTQTISKKAQRLIDEHALDARTAFPGLGLVREVDVIRFLERRAQVRMQESPQPPSPAAQAKSEPEIAPEPGVQAARVNSAYSTSTKPKGLFGDAAASAKDRGNKSVVWLAWNYLWRNWFLGHMVRVAPRGVILKLHTLRGVKMGHDVFIDPTAILETAFPENITIGNDVRITAGCVIMSHIKAPHYLRETGLVPVVLKPVVLEDHCFIGVNSVIMPGVTVGKASVVTSGSVVVTNVPPYSMVQGNPAKVIKQFPKPE